MDPLLQFDRTDLGALNTLTLGSSTFTDTLNNSKLANTNTSSSKGSFQGYSFLFRKRDGSSWITFYRSASGEVKALLSKGKKEEIAYLPVKGLPSYLKIEQVGQACLLLQDSQIRLRGDQIEVTPWLKGGMIQRSAGSSNLRLEKKRLDNKVQQKQETTQEDAANAYPDSPRGKTSVFLSYNWNQESAGKEVETIEQQLPQDKLKVIRDIRDLDNRENIDRFMKESIQTADYAVSS